VFISSHSTQFLLCRPNNLVKSSRIRYQEPEYLQTDLDKKRIYSASGKKHSIKGCNHADERTRAISGRNSFFQGWPVISGLDGHGLSIRKGQLQGDS
jgi:hypothetical protein